MDLGSEHHSGPVQQDAEDMEGSHYSESDTSTHGGEYVYETDSGTDSDEELHCGAEPYWVDVAAATGPYYQEVQTRLVNSEALSKLRRRPHSESQVRRRC